MPTASFLPSLLGPVDALLAQGHAHLLRACDRYGDLMVFLTAMLLVHEAAFLMTNGFYTLVGRVPSLRKYKIQPQATADPAQVWRAIRHIYAGRWLFQLPATTAFYYLWLRCGGSMRPPAPPTAAGLLGEIALMGLGMEALFYSLHRLFHWPPLYRRFHKRHHEFTAPVGISSEYASPLEDLVVNLPSTLLPGVLLAAHPLVLWAWLFLRVVETVDVHSGYRLPTSPFHLLFDGPGRHDYHHSHHTKGCYGALGLLDFLLGTDAEYRKWKQVEARQRQEAQEQQPQQQKPQPGNGKGGGKDLKAKAN